MKQPNLKYNYVIAGNEMYTPPMFKDLASWDGVRLYSTIGEDFQGLLSHTLFRLNFSKKINRFVSSPFNGYVNHRLYQPRFDSAKPLCIIFISDKADIFGNQSFLDTLRQNNPGIKLVLYVTDLVVREKLFDINYAQRNFDLIISYDKGDALKYGLEYHPTPHCKVSAEPDGNILPSDIYFCGKAKSQGRLDLIIDVYRKCQDLGIYCDFNITEVPEDSKRYADHIVYNHPLTYQENNQHITKAKAILEIMQDGATGFTPRLWDSIVNEKFLLTNNSSVPSSEFYRPEGMFLLHQLDETFVKKIQQPLHYPEKLIDRLSPTHFIEFIEQRL